MTDKDKLVQSILSLIIPESDKTGLTPKSPWSLADSKYQYVGSGLPNVYLTSGVVTTTNEEGETQVLIPLKPELDAKIGKCLLEAKRRLTVAEIKFIQNQLGVNYIEFAPDINLLLLGPEQKAELEHAEYFIRNLYANHLGVAYTPHTIMTCIRGNDLHTELCFGLKLYYGSWSWRQEDVEVR